MVIHILQRIHQEIGSNVTKRTMNANNETKKGYVGHKGQ